MSTIPENIPTGAVALFRKHLGMEADYAQWPACYQSLADELEPLIEMGVKWAADSSLETWFPMSAEELGRLRNGYLAKLASDYRKVDQLPQDKWDAGLKKITGDLKPGARVAWCFQEDIDFWERDNLKYPHPKDWPYQGFIMPFPDTNGRGKMDPRNVCLVITDYPVEKENPVTDWCVLALLFDLPDLHRIYVFNEITTAKSK